MSTLYQGLSEKAKIVIIACSAFIAVANILVAWYEADRALSALHMNEDDITQIKSISSDLSDEVFPVNEFHLRTHALNTLAHIKVLKNKQSIIIVTIGSGFALMAIGFSLFLLGADGALKVSGNVTNSTDQSNEGSYQLMLSATAPGLVCFILAGILISIGVSRQYSLEPGPVDYAGIKNFKPSPPPHISSPKSEAADNKLSPVKTEPDDAPPP